MKNSGFVYERCQNMIYGKEVLKCYKYHILKKTDKNHVVVFDAYPKIQGIGKSKKEAFFEAKLAMRNFLDEAPLNNEKGLLININKKNGKLVAIVWMNMKTTIDDIVECQRNCKRKRLVLNIVNYNYQKTDRFIPIYKKDAFGDYYYFCQKCDERVPLCSDGINQFKYPHCPYCGEKID